MAFKEDVGLFRRTDEKGLGKIYPRPGIYSEQLSLLQQYQFIGQMIGKALYEGVLVNVDFADFFLSKWLKKRNQSKQRKS